MTLSTTIAAETVPATSATQRLEQAAVDQELSDVKEELSKGRLQHAQMSARSEAMNALSPNLSVIAASTLLGSHIPPEALSSYLKLQSDIDIQNGLVREYERRVIGLRHGVSTAVVALAEAKQKAAKALGKAQNEFTVETRLFSLILTLFGLLVLLGGGYLLIRELQHSRKLDFHAGPVFGGASAIILILIGYQVFGLMGAAVAAAVVVIVVWAWLPKTDKLHSGSMKLGKSHGKEPYSRPADRRSGS